jgi:hypothetical protein
MRTVAPKYTVYKRDESNTLAMPNKLGKIYSKQVSVELVQAGVRELVISSARVANQIAELERCHGDKGYSLSMTIEELVVGNSA